MTLGELLRRAYGVAMTPLPASVLPDMDPAAVKAKLASMLPGPVDASGLPQMPEAWKRYALERGLYPEQRVPVAALQQLQQAPAAASGSGMWEWLHPQGTGATRRGFNDIYPGLGR
jgi:hypothetical protein